VLLLHLSLILAAPPTVPERPNVVIVFADDLGYGDLGCYGAKDWATPNLDRMAREGVRLTDCYVAQPVCSASRAALLTGCYPNRIGIAGALGPTAKIGLHKDEMTIGTLCQSRGYATAIVGKWHLGHRPEFLPVRRGFDDYFGLPYSNDMWPRHPEARKGTYPPLPLIDGVTPVNPDVTPEAMAKLTGQYTERAVSFIEKNKSRPFCLYVAHSMPHVPLYAGESAKGKSKGGIYGDVLQELDASVGSILDAIKRNGLDERTVVIFTSDNGPWLSYGNHAGSAGPLREGKGTVWEGGVRVPCVARWPGVIPAGMTGTSPLMTIDFLPTIAKWIGADLPKNRIDGLDATEQFQSPTTAKSKHDVFYFYFQDNQLQALRSGKWKYVLPHTYRTMQGQMPGKDGVPGKYRQVKLETAELYNLATDRGETENVAVVNPEVVKRMEELAEAAREDLGDSIKKHDGKNRRISGMSTDRE
jgi:arylsulfatase A